MQEDFVESVLHSLKENNLDPQYLELEITESVAMENASECFTKLVELQELGVTISIDDFGTGYSSLAYLKQLPLDFIKIDRSFVFDIQLNEDSLTIVTAIISMAKNLGLKIITEGVETSEQLEILKKLDCDIMQGFLFSKPLHPQDFEQYYRETLQKSAQ